MSTLTFSGRETMQISAQARISPFSRRAAQLRGDGEVAAFTHRDIAREIASKLVEHGLVQFEQHGDVVTGLVTAVKP